jgi:hypothetical protein
MNDLWRMPWRRLGALTLAWGLAAPLSAQSPAADGDARALPVGPPTKPAVAEAAATPDGGGAAASIHRPVWTRVLYWPWRQPRKTETVVVAGPIAPSDAELARVESGQASLVEMAATKIKADEAAVPARRAAIQYLSTIRCHYYPEAEAALIAALRADRNEQVRYDAAQALAHGCCCTPKTVEALQFAVNSSERDGNPAETSDRVKAVALYALQRAQRHGVPASAPLDMLPPAAHERTATPPPSLLQLTSYTLLQPDENRVTDAERRFAETAGLPAPGTPAAPTAEPARPASALPTLRIAPIAQLPMRTAR